MPDQQNGPGDKKTEPTNLQRYTILGMIIGTGIGVALGVALDNMGLMSIGIGAGMVLGMGYGASLDKKEKDESGDPGEPENEDE